MSALGRDRAAGQRAYFDAHARVGDSTSPLLAEPAARAAALRAWERGAILDRAEFAAAWLREREHHLAARRLHFGEAYIPLPGLGL